MIVLVASLWYNMEKKNRAGGDNMAGYDNFSMSNNARDAYRSGEMPMSKWTKQDILRAAKQTCPAEIYP
jgi:hypothetical protein